MFPKVSEYTMAKLKKFCQGKDKNKIKSMLEKVWNSEARNMMLILSNTSDIESLAEWLIK